MKFLLLLISFAMLPVMMSAQDLHPDASHAHSKHPHFRAAILIGHTAIPSGKTNDHVFIPSWGLDLEYWFTPQLGLGSHNDIEIEAFIVEVDHEETIERKYPVVTTLEILAKPWKGLVLQAGPGLEIEKGKNYALMRYGVEYEIELGHHWDLAPAIFYDSRMNAFDTWSIALGVGKRF